MKSGNYLDKCENLSNSFLFFIFRKFLMDNRVIAKSYQ